MPVIDEGYVQPIDFAALSEEEQVEAALQRYKRIFWDGDLTGNTSPARNIITIANEDSSGTNPPPLLSPEFFLVLDSRSRNRSGRPGIDPTTLGIKAGPVTFPRSQFALLGQHNAWWRSDAIDALCEAGYMRVLRTGPRSVRRCRYVVSLLSWEQNSIPKPRLGFDSRANYVPWPGLGRDASWRGQIIVSVVSVRFQTHFAALMIFGPARLVIPLDGEGGRLDHPDLKKRWTSLLSSRLEYELKKGWVTPEDNENWIFAPNIPLLRDRLGWVKQNDGNSCGPLATAAAIMVFQGVRPTAVHLGLHNETYSDAGIFLLRDSLVMVFMDEVLHSVKKLSESEAGMVSDHWLVEPGVMREIASWKARFEVYLCRLSIQFNQRRSHAV